MFEKLKILYIQNRIGLLQLEKAVQMKFITEIEKENILNSK